MNPEIYIYDTTLRDGAQSEGISYSLEDKLKIAKKLDEFRIHFIEGGWPFSNPKDKDFFDYFKKKKLKNSHLVAFGSTRYPHTPVNKDKNLLSLLKAETRFITLFGKSWVFHVREVLKTTLEENLKMIEESIRFLKKRGRKVIYDSEHFFDGYKDNPEYALKTLEVAEEAGSDWIVLCDTNGGSLPSEIRSIIKDVKKIIKAPLGIHAHNDSGLGVANSLGAVEEGVLQVQGTMNGYGERCGNADLITTIAVLQLKLNKKVIPPDKLRNLTELSHFISEISNLKHPDNHPFVGKSAFAHKGGVHINAIVKNPYSYEHIQPEVVGNQRRLLISEVSGKTPIIMTAKEMNYELDKKSPKAQRLHRLIKQLEREGYHFEAAEASFRLIIERELKKRRRFFELLGFRVIVLKREDGELFSEAIIKLKVKGQIQHTVAEGDGPVNALDNALRKSLVGFYPELKDMHLSDYKVRVLEESEGTAAKVRVLIESQDENESWTTIGVSENIIEASWQALVDSIEYKLLKQHRS